MVVSAMPDVGYYSELSPALGHFYFLRCEMNSVVTDSEFASESANFFPVRPSPNPRIFGSGPPSQRAAIAKGRKNGSHGDV